MLAPDRDICIHPQCRFIRVTCVTLFISGVINTPGEHTPVCTSDPFYPKLCSFWCRTPYGFPRAKQPHSCLSPCRCVSCSSRLYGVCLLLSTFSFIENTENHSETPAAPAPPPPALPKPKPKPKPKKSPVPPKGAAAGASPKGDEVPPLKKNTKAPGKQAPVPAPKPTSRNATREAGEYAPGGRVQGAPLQAAPNCFS